MSDREEFIILTGTITLSLKKLLKLIIVKIFKSQ